MSSVLFTSAIMGSCFCCFQLKKQHTLLHKLNGVLLLLTFFACRVLLFPYLYLAYSRWVLRLFLSVVPVVLLLHLLSVGRYASIPVLAVPLVAPWQCNLGAALLWPLQLYWFALICRRALRRPSASAPPAEK